MWVDAFKGSTARSHALLLKGPEYPIAFPNWYPCLVLLSVLVNVYIFSFTWPNEASSVVPESKGIRLDLKNVEERESVSILEWALSNQNRNILEKQTRWSIFKWADYFWQSYFLVLCSHQHFKPFSFKYPQDSQIRQEMQYFIDAYSQKNEEALI